MPMPPKYTSEDATEPTAPVSGAVPVDCEPNPMLGPVNESGGASDFTALYLASRGALRTHREQARHGHGRTCERYESPRSEDRRWSSTTLGSMDGRCAPSSSSPLAPYYSSL